ncbi:efflux transporter outer membrane subunit [candidate division CSSED10-310 bacterium]|uniref:Efflux transporter outer membrane subunit n=1 Tax=candidate division CSSED10-310 bacterium TaxID=2855610 RepID=A0ABV6YVV3_UNCC1
MKRTLFKKSIGSTHISSGYGGSGTLLSLLIMGILSLQFFSCAVQHKPLPVSVPELFSISGPEPLADKWWQSFGDPQLNQLIEQALLHNFDILIAWDRLDQAGALLAISKAGQWPQAQLDFGSRYLEKMGEEESQDNILPPGGNLPSAGSSSFSNGAQGSFSLLSEGSTHSLTFAASYELDLWGRIRASRQAAQADFLATREDLHSIAISLTSSVAAVWFELREAEAQLDLLAKQVQLNESYLKLLELRFQKGLVSAADVYQQRQQRAFTVGELPLIRARRAVLKNQLALLVGQPPTQFQMEPGSALPTLKPLPKTGLQADLLLRRPDVRAVTLHLEAADHRVAAALANRLPRLSISASASDEEDTVRSLYKNWLANIAYNITAPLFDAGRLSREVERTRAVAQERLHTFGRVALNALREVEDALVQEQQQRVYCENLVEQIQLARRTMMVTQTRFQNGSTDYLPVLTALQTLQSLERRQIEAKRILFLYRINLYRALAGGWELQRHTEQDV